MIYKPHNYQSYAIQHILDNDKAGIFMEMGLGKTSVTLTAVEWLLGTLAIDKPLIVAPKRVTSSTWPAEIHKWDHLAHLKISVIQGTEKQRIQAINTPADIYAVSRDNISWMVFYFGKQKKWPYDCLILDELSSFKNPSAIRFKALRKIMPYCRRVIGLTGTPSSNSLLDLWAQLYLLDVGQRLGTTIGAYKDKYFIPGSRNGHVVFQYIPKKDAQEQIFEAIGDLCISMKAKDYLDLPPLINIYDEIELENHERYLEFKKTEVLKMADGFELTPVNSAVLYSIMLQYANGAVYRYAEDGSRYYEEVDRSKINALVEEIEALQSEPVLIFCQFRSDFTRIKEAIPQAHKLETDQDIIDWNKKLIPVAMAHGQSIGHGLNLQDGGHHIIHFGLNWSLEIYEQSVSRLSRQGNKKSVINKHLICKGTVEELVLERLQNKAFTQQALFDALKRHLA